MSYDPADIHEAFLALPKAIHHQIYQQGKTAYPPSAEHALCHTVTESWVLATYNAMAEITSEDRNEGREVVRLALITGAGCGNEEHVPYKQLNAGQYASPCPEGDASNVIDALINAGWRPPVS